MTTAAALLLVVYALAAARVTVLITEDRITQTPRNALVRRIKARATARRLREWTAEYTAADLPVPPGTERELRSLAARKTAEQPPYLAYLLGCPWCAGFWVSLPAAAAWWFAGNHPALLLPAAALAISYAIGKLAQIGD